MVDSLPPARSPRRARFSREPQAIFVDDEQRTLATCYAISMALAAMWILAVHMLPAEVRRTFVAALDPSITIVDIPAISRTHSTIPPIAGGKGKLDGQRRDAGTVARASELFGGAGEMVGDALNSLRNVAVTKEGERAGSAGKAVLTYGGGGFTSGTSGMEKMGTVMRAGIGTVRGSGLSRAEESLSLPPVMVAAPAVTGMRDGQAIRSAVRSREAQLQYCYEREGLSRNPDLAGSIAVALTISGSGEVSGAEITRRSWLGTGVTETENCILATARAWKFPNSTESSATYAFPLSFTAGR
ncbi:MAG: AgmX/PglI C-terminal domain-containing protein [Anaerolineae bacterium]|nr:AgmX/PglI C-terminal domain-containing protein [Gemmatimonadaceae bacterium]